ncbi:MAG TPA: dihydrofolate reductase family protein [Blastocatellia bacterium]|nr:dihydrofolate reductase family protein [Blastocatellia bacterium]
MAKLVANISVSLDGVMQAPARSDEDTRGNFKYGGWATPYFDPTMAETAAKGMATTPSVLLGRRTYKDFYKVWAGRTDNPFSQFFDKTQKYVASRTLSELTWINSTLLKGDATESVAKLKQTAENDLLVLGSGHLLLSLMADDLVDEFILSIHPIVLGSGRRLFADSSPYRTLQLVDSKITSTGVIMATYRPNRAD